MTAPILSIFSRWRGMKTLEQEGRDRVEAALRRRGLPATILRQAQARVVRAIAGGVSVDDAVRRAVAWATVADHGDDLPPAI